MIDCTPSRYDTGSVQVSVGGKATRETGKFGLRSTVRFIDMATLGTFARRILGIDKDHWNASQYRFVDQKSAKLCEGPTMQNRPLISPSPDLLADILEIFQDYRLLRASGVFNNPFRDYMIRVRCKPCFLAGQFLQFALCGASLLLLQFGAQAAVSMPNGLNGRPAVLLSVAGRSNLSNTKIDAEKPIDIDGVRCIHVADRSKVEDAVAQDQIGLSLPGLQEFSLSGAGLERDLNPSFKRPDGDSLDRQIPGQNAVIERECPIWPERSLGLFVQFVGIADLADTADYNLSGQAEVFPGIGVGQFVQSELPESFGFPGAFADPITTSISFAKRVPQSGGRIFRRYELYFGNQLHCLIVAHCFQYGNRNQLKVNRLKAVVSNLGGWK